VSSYALLSVAFLAAAVVVMILAVARRRREARAIVRWLPAAVASALLLLVLTGLFDNLMIAAGFMVYHSGKLLGARIGAVPLEDFAYPIAAVILLPSLWSLARRRAADD
jgi:lycopene cyclase domain-containing protein